MENENFTLKFFLLFQDRNIFYNLPLVETNCGNVSAIDQSDSNSIFCSVEWAVQCLNYIDRIFLFIINLIRIFLFKIYFKH